MGGIRNFQVCARCRNHGVRNILKGHKKTCSFKQCDCEKCLVTKDRQNFIAREIAMHRYEIKNKNETENNIRQGLKLNLVRSKSSENKSPHSVDMWITKGRSRRQSSIGEVRKDQNCSRCRNHGVVQLLRGHKNACLYVDCICDKCEITKKRREIMAKQIKDYRNHKSSDCSESSPDTVETSESIPDIEALMDAQQFVNYEPIENRDIFYMVQSLFEKYTNENADKKIQLIYAFAHLAKGNWSEIEKSLDRGEIIVEKHNLYFNVSNSCKN